MNKINKQTDGFGFSNINEPSEIILPTGNPYPVSTLENNRDRTKLFQGMKYSDNDYTFSKPKLSGELPDTYVYFDVIKNYNEMNNLINVFFSKKNVDHIQLLIIKMIKHVTGYSISQQDTGQILNIMRDKYMNTPIRGNVTGDELMKQVCALNKDVVEMSVPLIHSRIQQYISYIRDHGMNPYEMELPKLTYNRGLKLEHGFDKVII